MRKMSKSILIFLLFVVYLFKIGYSQWTINSLPTGLKSVYGNEFAFGDARNEEKNRFYVVQGKRSAGTAFIDNLHLYEITWDGVICSNEIVDVIYGDYVSCEWISVGDAQNDGNNRIYLLFAKTINNEYKWYLREYSWSGSSWTKNEIFSGASQNTHGTQFIIDDARNDAKKRIYTAGRNDRCVSEFSWSGSSWTVLQMPMPPEKVSFTRVGVNESVEFLESNPETMVIGDGRNDGLKRIYVHDDYDILEYSWENGNWNIEIAVPNADLDHGSSIVLGDARNDGQNHLYSVNNFDGWYVEYTFNGTTWDVEIIQQTTGQYENPSLITIADVRNDNIKRIYGIYYIYYWEDGVYPTPDNQKQMPCFVELSWNGSSWNKTIIRNEKDDFGSMVIGDGRNDSVTRIYSTSYYEYTYNPFNEEKIEKGKLVPVNNYFNPVQDDFTSIWYKIDKTGHVKLKLYTINGRLVKVLEDREMSPGEYAVNWYGDNYNGDTVASGIYLIHLEASGESKTKKICVVK